MKHSFEQKINIKNGIIFSDPWYNNLVECRYQNTKEMKNFILTILTTPSEEFKDYYSVAIALLHPQAFTSIRISDELNSFSIPENFEIKDFEIGIDTATVIIGSNHDFIEPIHTGSDGLLGTLFEINNPNKEYCGIVFLGAFDVDFITPEELIKVLKYNFTQIPNID